MNNSLYSVIRDNGTRGNVILYTVVDGPHRGRQQLFCCKDVIWPVDRDPGDAATEMQVGPIQWPDVTESGLYQCGEDLVFCQSFGDRKELVVCGAGHVGVAVVEAAKRVGFAVTVLEDRSTFAAKAYEAGADRVICDPFEVGLTQVGNHPGTCFVIVTRGHEYDLLCLKAALQKPHGYVGMMGSKGRVALVKQQLIEEGMEEALVESTHTPIGLDIGAETPEEIAISILAQIIQIRSRKKCTAGFTGKMLDAIEEGIGTKQPTVLSTIISKRGSGPRNIGTKMLVCQDGSCVDTIGGGSVEARVVEESLKMLRELDSRNQIIRVNLSGEDAAKEGMVCGGVLDIYMEKIL